MSKESFPVVNDISAEPDGKPMHELSKPFLMGKTLGKMAARHGKSGHHVVGNGQGIC